MTRLMSFAAAGLAMNMSHAALVSVTDDAGTPLATASGFMQGAYHMVVADSGEGFDVAIPAFSLDSPHQPSGRVH